MYLYNSATHKKEEFKTHTPGHVEMYTCGPTVYHFAHIGNLRSYIMEDVLEKYLRYAGYDVNRVMNITDVGHLTSDADEGEDKMLKGAKREHKSVMEIAQYYTDAFFSDCRKLNIKRPDVVQPATGLIDDYIKIITKLIDTGYAYLAGGNVYFDTSKLKRYYIFNDHNEEDLAVGVREGVEEDTNKRNKNDFVLWFTKSKFEDQALKWDSPWGVGYPGWHIECSGISMKYNGEYLDLHCGGVDNAFPHHTNEIAQSESYLGHPWCPHWCHVAHLNTDHGKMSKSKGEFLTVSLLEEKGYDPLAYRFFCLQSHYRKSLVFTWENLDNATVAYNKLLARIAALKDEGDVEQAAFDEYKAKFMAAMDNDLNTSMAVTVLYDVLKAKTNDKTKLALLDSFDTVLGLKLLEKAAELRAKQVAAAPAAGGFAVVSEDGEENAEVEALIRARADAKKAKNFAEADRIRDELKAQGIYEESLIVFTSDHGEMLGSHGLFQKMCMYEESARTPLYIKFPKGFPLSKQVFEKTVGQVDLLPTFCDYLGLHPENAMDGRSLMPLLEGREEDAGGEAFIQYDGNGSCSNFQRCIVKDGWKLIVDMFKDEAFFELYDLENDPQETENRMFSGDQDARALKLWEILGSYMRRTGDRLRLPALDPEAFRRAYAAFPCQ